MKTLRNIGLAAAITLGLTANASANTMTDNLTEAVTEAVSKQLAELSISIRQQAQQALQSTAGEILFNNGSQQAEQAISPAQVNADKSSTTTNEKADK